MSESIFSKIVQGVIPCHKVFEDELTLAFLDIHPAQPGHTLVIPKSSTEFIWDLEPAEYAAVMATCQLVGRRLREVMGVSYVGVQVIGTDIPHAHVHLIPFNTTEEFRTIPDQTAEPDHDALASLAARLAF